MSTPHSVSPSEGVRARVQRLSERQHQMERFFAAGLGVDHHGLMVVNALLTDGPSTPSELAERLGVSTAVMSLVLQRLDSGGHLTRAPHPHDRRKTLVDASATARETTFAMLGPVMTGLSVIVGGLSPAEQDAIARFLDALDELYDTVARDGYPRSVGRP